VLLAISLFAVPLRVSPNFHLPETPRNIRRSRASHKVVSLFLILITGPYLLINSAPIAPTNRCQASLVVNHFFRTTPGIARTTRHRRIWQVVENRGALTKSDDLSRTISVIISMAKSRPRGFQFIKAGQAPDTR
jgi:hypothetical protein